MSATADPSRVPLARPSSMLVASVNRPLRSDLRRAVQRDQRFTLVEETDSVDSTVERLGRAPFLDVVVLDRQLPGLEDRRALEALAAASPSSAVVVHPGRESATASGTSDPTTFVAALAGGVVGRTQDLLYPGSPSPVDARRFVADACERTGATAITESAELVTSELVTNALQHGSPPIGLHVELTPATVRIDVRDGNRDVPSLTAGEPNALSGRGLRLVGAFAMAWGFHHVIGGKAIWAVLARPR